MGGRTTRPPTAAAGAVLHGAMDDTPLGIRGTVKAQATHKRRPGHRGTPPSAVLTEHKSQCFTLDSEGTCALILCCLFYIFQPIFRVAPAPAGPGAVPDVEALRERSDKTIRAAIQRRKLMNTKELEKGSQRPLFAEGPSSSGAMVTRSLPLAKGGG